MSGIVKKEAIIQDIKSNFQKAQAVIFYNFHHLENEDIFQLKKELKRVGGHWKVYKNNLVAKAVLDYSLKLQQANAFIFCWEDEYKPLNILGQFGKKYPTVSRFQGGIYNQNVINNTLLEKWADLPSKEILISNVCYYLNWQIGRLINVLRKIKWKIK